MPSLRYACSLENDVLSPTLSQVIAHSQASLATADDDCVVSFPNSILSEQIAAGSPLAWPLMPRREHPDCAHFPVVGHARPAGQY